MSTISKKHLAFINEYFANGFNATRAYKSVYKKVTEASAAERGSKLLRHVNVAPIIKKMQEENAKKFEIRKEDLANDLLDIKNSCKQAFPPTAVKAIEVLNKMYGFDAPKLQKIEHSGDMSISISVIKPDDES